MRKRPLCLLCICVLILIAATIFVAEEETESSDSSSSMAQAIIQLEGTVLQKSVTEKQQTLTVGNLQSQFRQHSFKQYNMKEKKKKTEERGQKPIKRGQILVYDDTFCDIKIGDRIWIKGEGKAFEEARNPGNFDQRAYYEAKRIRGFLWARQIFVTRHAQISVGECFFRIREKGENILKTALGEKNGGILSAMLLGEKAGMDPEVKELYQKSGISHLLAISGLHLALIGNAFYGLLRKSGCSFLSAGVMSVTALGAYACMTGMSVSTQRALLMFGLRLGAEAAGRVYDLPTALAVTAVWVVVGNPKYLTDAGFLLSFGAIMGIVLLCPIMQEVFAGKRKLLQALCGSVAVTVFLYPITSFFYYEISPYAVFLNLIVIPLMSWILGAGIVGMCVAFLWMPAGGVLLKGCGILLEVYEALCRLLLRLPYAVIVTGKPELWQIFLYYSLLLGFVFSMRKQIEKKNAVRKAAGKAAKKNRGQKNEQQIRIPKEWEWSWRQKTGSVLWILGLMLFLNIEVQKKTLEVTFLDVGQGDGIFLQTDSGLTCMIDGGSTDVKQVGKYRIEPFLKSKGVRKLDYVFITHGDQDHLNGIAELLERQAYGIQIDMLVLPEKNMWDDTLLKLARQANRVQTKVAVMEKGDVVGNEEVSIKCIQPTEDSEAKPGNEASLVLKLTCHNRKLLFTGDVEGKGEEELLQNFQEEILLLKVAHHGSNHSTFEPFLEQTRPKYAIISAGIDNSYGHPGKETLLRLKKYGAKIYSTQDHGAISFFIEEGKTYLTGWK